MGKHMFGRSLRLTMFFGAALAMALGADAMQSGRQGRASAPQAQVQKLDEDYTKRILDNTPDKRILTELVDHMPISTTVPSPLKFLGYVPGENNRLTYHKDIVAYYEALDKVSMAN